jgi:biotin carboxyl carrier protein
MYFSDKEVHLWIVGIGSFICKLLPRFVEIETEVKGSYTCPMPGEIVKILVQPGEKVEAGQKLLILSSMKMESSIEANESGIVKEIFVEEKQFVEAGKELLCLEDAVQG